MATHGYTWLYSYTWLNVAIRGYTGLYMAIHGYTWLYMALRGYTQFLYIAIA
jgi:hypothetical protein